MLFSDLAELVRKAQWKLGVPMGNVLYESLDGYPPRDVVAIPLAPVMWVPLYTGFPPGDDTEPEDYLAICEEGNIRVYRSGNQVLEL